MATDNGDLFPLITVEIRTVPSVIFREKHAIGEIYENNDTLIQIKKDVLHYDREMNVHWSTKCFFIIMNQYYYGKFVGLWQNIAENVFYNYLI